MFFARCSGRDRIIVDVGKRFCAGPGISRELVDRCESNAFVVRDDRFGPVAVMCVEIPDRDALSAVLEGIERRDGDVAEITKAHRPITHGVMTRWSIQYENALA